jgi:peptidoglycan/LPS O-acetylase OafA/YrhL
VLSGFVIYYSTIGKKQELNVKYYLKRRVRRIYPVFIIALLLAWVLQSIYEGQLADPNWKELLGNLLQLQDKNPYALAKPYMHNLSLWTLSYEFYFYLLFIPLFLFAKRRPEVQLMTASGISLFGFISFWLFPNQFSLFLSYFILWWSGAEFCKEYLETGSISFRRQAKLLLVLGIMAVLWCIPMVQAYLEIGKIGRNQFPFIQAQHFVLVFAIVIFALVWSKFRYLGLDFLVGWAAWFAPISYGLYVFHLPIIYFSLKMKLTSSPWLDLLWVLPLLFAISWLAEKPIQKQINKLFP